MYTVGSIFRVAIFGLFADTLKMSNVYQFYLASGAVPFTFAEIVDELAEVVTEICEAVAAVQWDGFSWTSYSVATLDDAAVSGEVQLIAPIPGEVEGAPLPSQTTLQIRWATGYSRRILKKAYPAIVEADTGTGQGNYSGATLTAWGTVASLMLGTFEASNSAWQYVYKTPDTSLDPLIVFPRSGTVSAVPKVQRRRRLG